MFAVMVICVEVCSAGAYWSGLVLADPIYRPEFDCSGCKTVSSAEARSLPKNAFLGWGYYDPELGWDSYRNGKRAGPPGLAPCASAFGDSFTHGDEVQANEAWPFRLSELLGCEVENFGVGGYGQDQAYLKYLKYRPKGQLVLLAINEETMRRNFAASWRFYAGLPNTLPKPMFHLDGRELVLDKAPQRLDAVLIAAHHRYDRYADPYRVGFPYFFSLLRVLYYRLIPSAYAGNRIEPYNTVWNNPAAVNLSLRLLEKNLADVITDRKKLAVILLPEAAEVASNQRAYAHYIDRVQEQMPETCLIDPFATLRAQYQSVGPLNQPDKHFNAAGNTAIAAAVFTQLKQCGLNGGA
jgi:hypothetical protein